MSGLADNGKPVIDWLGDERYLSLAELCRLTRLSADELIEMVEEGVLDPAGGRPCDWSFPAPAVRRVQVAVRLQRDLRVNLAGTAVVLELLDEIRALRSRIHILENSD